MKKFIQKFWIIYLSFFAFELSATTHLDVSKSFIPSNENKFIENSMFSTTTVATMSMVPVIRIREGVTGNGHTFTDSDLTPAVNEGTDISLPVGCTVGLGYRIENASQMGDTLLLTGNPRVSITGDSEFIISTQPDQDTIFDGDGRDFVVQFSPTSTEAKTCTLSIASNDPNIPVFQLVIRAQANLAGRRVHVDTSATGNNDGTSWTDAYTSLHTAIDSARFCDTIWVASGVYAPQKDRHSDFSPTDPKTKTFRIEKDILLYGGFQGNEMTLSQRDFKVNKTILSGDIDQNDTNTDGNKIAEDTDDIQGQNAYHIIRISDNSKNIRLDGFYITAGHANGSGDGRDVGGGVFTGGGIIENCQFMGNFSNTAASALLIFSGPATISNCAFSGNNVTGGLGGSVVNAVTSSAIYTNCAFFANKGSSGVGVLNAGATSSYINCTFSGNINSNANGVIHNIDFALDGGTPSVSNTSITNCVVWNNQNADGLGGASTSVTVDGNSTFMSSFSLLQGLNPAGTSNLDGTNPNNNPDFKIPFDNFSNIFEDEGDLCLQNTSPAAETGNSTANNLPLDLKCNPRIFGSTIDMGCYELQEAKVDPTGEPCTENSISVDVSPTSDTLIHAIQTLATNGTIVITNNVTFQAGQSITLNPGFHAQAGHTFLARIVSCAGLQDEETIDRTKEIETNTALKMEVYPNPISYNAIISYHLPETDQVYLSVFNMQGKEVKRLIDQKGQVAGTYYYNFKNSNLEDGLYFLGLRTSKAMLTKKIMILN